MTTLTLSGLGEGGGEGAKDANEHGVLGIAYNVLNTGLILGSLTTGLGILFRRRSSQVTARRFHRLFGWSLVSLFVLDLILVTGPTGMQSVIEAANLGLLAVLLLTSLFLFTKPRALMCAWYWPARNVHVATAMIYAVKFFAEPLTGGKLG